MMLLHGGAGAVLRTVAYGITSKHIALVKFICSQKRPAITPVTFDSDGAKKIPPKTDQKMYMPPGGKFSEKAGTYQGNCDSSSSV